MSMRREEAFKKYKAWRDLGYGHSTMPSSEVLVMALDALHPITREQVEKVWPGCDICRGDKKIKSDNFCGAATMQIVGDSIDLRGDEKKIKFLATYTHRVFL